uniref:Globin CTT-VI n=1 Tax=Chironomus thummi thummi TaxID=7155 RepID=GLB6_CHITH|nr:RecName: Full=Globin CTT-VI; Flags: Precursor [Chironomus thummi thummi]AAA69813.1 hemeprotein [Chironomus thummi thummi]AAA69814.1 hemeprotein [Chironomus thummi thummi]
MKFLVLALCIAAASAAVLTTEQADLVKKTWSTVKFNEVDILYAVFKAYPDIMAKFPQFAGKDLDSIKDSAAFATHATRIVSFLSEVISLAGSDANIPAIQNLAKELATSHKPRGVSKDQFTEFRTALFTYLKAHINFDGPTETAWTLALDTTYAMLFSAMDS